jgi:serine/threonine protein kinase/Tol biopolymer transport system component
MDAERWRDVERLYQAAMARPADDREVFLAKACAGDEALRREVAGLLHTPRTADGLFAAPAAAAFASMAADSDTSMLTGRRLGVYHLHEQIGAGGMGQVYRARDTRLGRDVAIKILPRAFTTDRDRMARFEREARVLAALNHPNISAIYGVEEGPPEAGLHLRGLVLELVEGETLADRVRRGPIPISDALAVAKQIADALDAAHEKGIVHRDLKPANIKITPGGVVKVLDFGLARWAGGPGTGADSQTPTMTVGATHEGVILGTAAYMSPEQARGEPVDEQADVWAFGCVLFEMLTGRAVFHGRSVSDVLAAVLRAEPEWQALPALHPRIMLLLERCLEKDKTSRYHDIADARADLQKALTDPSGAVVPAVRPGKPRAVAWWTAAAVTFGAVVIGFAAWSLRAPQDRAAIRFSDVLPQNRTFTSASHSLVAVSPDGLHIAYVADNQLFLRPMDRPAARPIMGTEGAPTTPFFSPDGRFVGYFDFRDGELRRISVGGGTAVGVTKVTNVFGASWQEDDTILYGAEDGIWKVSADGGTPEAVVRVAPGERAHGPQLLPGGESILFTLRTGVGSSQWQNATLVVQSLRTGERKTIRTGSDARFLPTGHLVYAAGFTLFANGFDLSTLEPIGGSVPLIEGIRRAVASPGNTGTANYDVSRDGVLVYVPGEAPPPIPRQLVAVDRNGNAEPLIAEMRDYWRPRVSPDGSHVAVEVREDRGERLWVVDLKDGAAALLAADGAYNIFSTWTADGQSVIFRSDRADQYGIYVQPADGSGPAKLLYAIRDDVMPGHVSRDGVLVFASGEQTGRRSIWTMRLNDTKATEFLATPALEHMPVFSPDGKWIAYASNESGREEVYIRSYPFRVGMVRRISEGGGTAPVWAPDGSELYYRSADGNLMAVPLQRDAGITPGRAVELFKVQDRFRTSGNAAAYDIEPNGRRFIMVTQENPPPIVQQVTIVLNWYDELKRLVPTN